MKTDKECEELMQVIHFIDESQFANHRLIQQKSLEKSKITKKEAKIKSRN